MKSRRIKKLFIPNRGEICRRIASTASRMGIATVTVTERNSPPAYLLDIIHEFVKVPEESASLYLDAKKMISIAKETGCDAVHPGFGFLSENAEFAKAVIDADLNWVGPNPEAIHNMASKATARNFADKAEMPCIEGLKSFPIPKDETGDFSEVTAFARKTNFPLLIKATFGGGGKGMRLVEKVEDLKEAILRAHSEAVNAFGNGALICEKYLTSPRHVEVQVLADRHGNVVAVGDRDCSVQRRHQKIIEEAPAPELSTETRAAMHGSAVRLAKAVGYDNAGTIEFMVDWSKDARKEKLQQFYFLEMNTRLQVEHPVTEEVFGLDLVEWQLKVAQGEKLSPELHELQPRGHSIEARLYAEDATNNFMPAPSPVLAFLPAQGPGVRWEVGIDTVDVVSERFDPMVAKLVVRSTTRENALKLLSETLERTVFAGPTSNLPLLRMLCSHSVFAKEPVSTHYLTHHLSVFLERIQERSESYRPAADKILLALERNEIGLTSGTVSSQHDIADITEAAFSTVPIKKTSSTDPGALEVGFENIFQSADGGSSRIGRGTLRSDGQTQTPFWYTYRKDADQKTFWVQLGGCHYSHVKKTASWASEEASGGSATDVVAPVPGAVVAVKVKEGDEVEANTTAFILESMKMEFEVKTSKAGKIGKINVNVGDQITAGEVLAAWEQE